VGSCHPARDAVRKASGLGGILANDKPPMGTIMENLGGETMNTTLAMLIGAASGLLFANVVIWLANKISQDL